MRILVLDILRDLIVQQQVAIHGELFLCAKTVHGFFGKVQCARTEPECKALQPPPWCRLFDTSGKPIGPYRVWLQQSWVPGLAMSRALGDAVAHTVGVTSQPDTEVFTITRQDRFLILASDGIWEFIDGQGAVEMISGCSTAEEACRIVSDDT